MANVADSRLLNSMKDPIWMLSPCQIFRSSRYLIQFRKLLSHVFQLFSDSIKCLLPIRLFFIRITFFVDGLISFFCIELSL
ncbi:MAG: hypothetical protein CMN67_15800 [Sphingomonadaceae bacterium]|nr:hypothetical protein [Sphingomonadaceae bacterium]